MLHFDCTKSPGLNRSKMVSPTPRLCVKKLITQEVYLNLKKREPFLRIYLEEKTSYPL
jgi:hypothetical protein